MVRARAYGRGPRAEVAPSNRRREHRVPPVPRGRGRGVRAALDPADQAVRDRILIASSVGRRGEMRDPALRLSELCAQQGRLGDAGVQRALDTMRQHSSTTGRFVQAMTRLARYKMDSACAEEESSRAICAAIEARRTELQKCYDKLELVDDAESHATSEHALSHLARRAEEALEEIRAAETDMRGLGALDQHL